MTLGLGMQHWGCWAYQVCSNNDPRLTLTYLTSRSNLLPNAFELDFFFKKTLFSLDMLNLVSIVSSVYN